MGHFCGMKVAQEETGQITTKGKQSMIKLMKYLKKSAGYIVLIIGLLFLQAYCDLSLPDYTSKIINVGIQQGGIPDGVPEKLRQSTMESLEIFMDEDTQNGSVGRLRTGRRHL